MAFEDLHGPLTRAGFRGAVKWIILISGIILVLQQLLGSYVIWGGLTPGLAPQLHADFITLFGLIPALVIKKYWLWQPFTYLFLHGGLFHWLFNMLILWMFGAELERRWGTAEFLKYFFVTGVGAAACVLA